MVMALLVAQWGTLRLLTNGVKVHVPIVRIGMTEDDVLASNPVVLLVTGRMLCFVTL